MTPPVAALAERLRTLAAARGRIVVAIAGAPGAGKSTLADTLVGSLNGGGDATAVLVPMDGFHLDNVVLEARGLLARKGAPPTFDAAGLAHALHRIRAGEDEVVVPLFDRARDLARAGARVVHSGHAVVVVEGNYLLLRDPPWDALGGLFDLTVWLEVPAAVLRDRLVARWLDHGLSPDAALHRAEENDLPNARLAVARSRPADLVL